MKQNIGKIKICSVFGSTFINSTKGSPLLALISVWRTHTQILYLRAHVNSHIFFYLHLGSESNEENLPAFTDLFTSFAAHYNSSSL